MLTGQETENLRAHVVGVFQGIVIPQITANGCILSADSQGSSVYEDPVATHHLVEFCAETAPGLTADIVGRACDWFRKNNQGVQDPFFLTTLARAGQWSVEQRGQILQVLQEQALPSGMIPIYAGFMDGSSQFSTLWAIRIAQLVDSRPSAMLGRAYGAIEAQWGDMHRSSFKGYLAELIATGPYRAEKSDFALRAISEVIAAQNANGTWDRSLLYTAYLAGNLLSTPGEIPTAQLLAAENALRHLFSLETKANELPARLAAARGDHGDSAFTQLCLRAIVSAARYLRRVAGIEVADDIGRALVGYLPRVYRTAVALDAELKKMKEQYGHIAEKFAHLDERATRTLLSKSPYEKNVFIMIPFRHEVDERFETVVTTIKAVLEENGMKGWIAADLSADEQLWDNVVCYMLACKYGIAVFARIDDLANARIDTKTFNPNVSLELGFFLSRGKEVLVLKDKPLPTLQADLAGRLYKEFDLNRAKTTVASAVSRWVNEINEKNGK